MKWEAAKVEVTEFTVLQMKEMTAAAWIAAFTPAHNTPPAHIPTQVMTDGREHYDLVILYSIE